MRRPLAVAAAVLVLMGCAGSGRFVAAPQPLATGLPDSCRASDPSPWRFMFTGDSMTHGVGQTPYWAPLLNRMWGVPRTSVGSQTSAWGAHEGIPGQTAAQLGARLPGLMTNYHPNVVVLAIGTNLDGDGVTTLTQIAIDMDLILAADPCVRLLVATIAYEYDSIRSAHAQYVNDHIPDLVRQRDDTGTRVRWVDLTFVPMAGTTDRLHWTSGTADVVSWRVFKEVQHFVGITVGDDRWLPYSAANLPDMPARTGTSTTG